MIQEKIDKYLLEDEAKKANRTRSGKWSPSSFGRCYRYQYWNRLNEPLTNPISIDTLKIFKVGNIIHRFFQDILKGDYIVEAKIETEDCLGFADLVGLDEVIDIKSARSYLFRLIESKKKKLSSRRNADSFFKMENLRPTDC